VSGRRVDEISIEELEQLIAARKVARAQGQDFPEAQVRGRRLAWRRWGNLLLTLVEVGVILALVLALVSWFRARGASNTASVENMAQIWPTPTTAPAIAAYLPGSHTPPTSPGGAQPIDASIPEHLRPLITEITPAPLPTVEPQPQGQPVRIVIPSVGVDALVVQGDDWDTLKLGVGHHIGSTNPGQRGNMVLSAHNDIYGEIFRHLADVQLEDEIIVHTTTRAYRYVVRAKRIIKPTQVEVMDPTREPVVTLISCYPYLIDTQRIVVIGELVGEGEG
jgi:sortase A